MPASRPCLVIIASASLLLTSANAGEIDFNRDVRPILSNKCLLCHGPDDEGLQAGLRLDLREAATEELDSGAVAVVPGKPEASELIARVTTDDDDLRMPPADHGAKLSLAEVDVLSRWIQQGARFATHWSYVKPVRSAVPTANPPHQTWPQNAIDNFVLQAMVERDMQPSLEADRIALARRVFLDLTGLPPTIEEVDAFVANTSPQAYEDLVDGLLNRPTFGEHWARKWLDLARYADSAGYADDPPRTIWAYRDWVINAINSNMPFDQFTVEQMAGDLLPKPTESQLIATAFHRNTLTNNEGGTQDEEFRNVAIVDRVNTTMAVWMGTTMACAQCHTHKYDPITQDEYFRFFAILNNTQDADRRDESPKIEIYTDEQRQKQSELKQQIADLTRKIDQATPELQAAQTQWERQLHAEPQWQSLMPSKVRRKSEQPAKILDDGAIAVETETLEALPTKDTYFVSVPLEASQSFSAVRLSAVPDDSLPRGGSGHANGNFVITGIQAQLIPDGASTVNARFVRVTNKGEKKILSLAEVQIFSGEQNVAQHGKASQHSTASAGPAQLAIDGDTNGDYQNESVTHTDTATDPWWEVDLGQSMPIDRIVIWNRTDNKLQSRLKDFTVTLLDENRQPVTEQTFDASPDPAVEYLPSHVRDVSFARAFADYHQPDFEPADVLTGKTGSKDGWAIGGATDQLHHLLLIPKRLVTIDQPATLRLTIQQNSPHSRHLLGHFRVSTTTDDVAIQRSRIPANLLAIIDLDGSARSAMQASELAAYFRENIAKELDAERRQLSAAKQQLSAMKPATSVPVLRELTQNRRITNLQFRGSYLDTGPEVSEGVPAVFHAVPDEAQLDRRILAEWLTSPENPLTARVLANRYWETIFGRGIVVTSEEFGSQGELPTHPELLDWLATEIVDSGWDTKAFLKLLVTSATYRQSARVTPDQVAADPDNRWLARGPRLRLSAEMVRDQALFAAGLLSDKMFGPPVNPPQPNMGLKAAFGGATDWKTSSGEDRYRRGIYTTWRRSNPYPSMATFDAPNREVCTVRRNSTNTPLQSLVTLNDPVYVEAAQALARKALRHSDDLSQQLTHAFRRCVLRPPTDAEVSALAALFDDTTRDLADHADEALQLATEPLGTLPEGLQPVNAAAMMVVCNVLLNLDEMFLKR